MPYIPKDIRLKIWNKYNHRCAYCGKELEYSKMQVDHIQAHWHNGTDEECRRWKVTKGDHTEENFNPSCARCNRWKGTFTVEQFRREIEMQYDRLKRDSPGFRLASDYSLIMRTQNDVIFYFEKYNALNQ